MRALGGYAITMPWGRAYIRSEWFADESTRFHESIHLMQIERDGAVTFTARYLWWLWRFGYRGNPYEIEAYRLEAQVYGEPK